MIDKKFIINIQGQEFVKFEGLLNDFHQNGGKSIYTKIINVDPLIMQATAKGEKGVYQGIGDADEKNVNRMIVNHKIRMAETRAIARALRLYNNIGMCSAEELGDDYNSVKNTQKSDKISSNQAKSLLWLNIKEKFNFKEEIPKGKEQEVIDFIENKSGIRIKNIDELKNEAQAKLIINSWT